MPATYAGVNLSLVRDGLALWVERNFPVSDPACRFRQMTSPRLGFVLPPTLPRVRPGRLLWPRDASRWAVGYYVVTQSQLDLIRDVIYSDGYTAAPHVLDDGFRTLTTDLWMLPPRQINGSIDRTQPPSFANGNPFFVMELVDDRYFWWYRSADVEVVTGSTPWENLIGQIETGLGVTVEVAAIDPDFLGPTDAFTAHYEALPILLDAVANALGRRVVRQLDGTVEMLTSEDSQSRQEAEIEADRSVMAGGLYSLGS